MNPSKKGTAKSLRFRALSIANAEEFWVLIAVYYAAMAYLQIRYRLVERFLAEMLLWIHQMLSA